MIAKQILSKMWMLSYFTAILSASALVYFTGVFGVLVAFFLAFFLPHLWSGRAKFSLFFFLAVFMPLFPIQGFEIWGRNLDWFDALMVMVGFWNLTHAFSTKQRDRWDPVLVSSSIFLCILLMLSIRSPQPEISFRDLISYFVNFFLTYWIMERFSSQQLLRFLQGLFLSSCVVSLVAFWQKFNDFSFPDVADGEVTIRLGVPGTFEDSLVLSMYSGTMLVLVMMGWFRYKDSHFRILCLLTGFANLLSLRLALSRNGIFLLGAALLCFLLIRFYSWAKDRKSAMKIPLVVLGLPVGGWLGLHLLPQDIYYRIVSAFYLFSGSNDPVILYNIRSTLGRFENYKEAVKIFLENPWEGIGLGLYPVLTRFDDADGFYTGLLAETGLSGSIGFLIFALCVLIVVIRSLKVFWGISEGWNSQNSGIRIFYELFAGLCFGYFLTSFFEPVFKVQIMSFLFFFFLRMMSLEAEGSSEVDWRPE